MGNMRPFVLVQLVLSAAAFLLAVVAIELPESVVEQATSELDDILHAARIDFAPLTHDNAQESARSLITDTQRARIAIAQHVVTSTPLTQTSSTLSRAKDLQDQLMGRVQSHLSTQLDQGKKVEEVEWDLHRGFRNGLYDTEDKLFVEQVLQPDKFEGAEERVAKEAGFKERLAYMLKRIRGGLRDMNPVVALRRWRVRRLLKKLSTQPPTSPLPPLSAGVSPAPSNPLPWNIQQLRSRLSSITALKSTQSQSAAADAHDASSTARIQNTPVIQSDIVLNRPLVKPEPQPQKMQYKVSHKARQSAADVQRAPRTWTHTYNRNHGGHVEDWSKMVIPDMAIPATAR